MKADMKKQVAVITGGASGIGFAVSKKFTAEGIRVEIIGRDHTRLKLACEALGSLADYTTCDLGDLESIPGVVEKIVARYGRIDILVNNAGIDLKKPLAEITDEEYQNVILTNQTSQFSLTREISGFMKLHGGGSVVNIGSMASRFGLPGAVAFTASKAAIEGMTRAMAVELAGSGIRVNCVAPGYIKTNVSSSALDLDPERKKRILARTPLGRLGRPAEVAEAAFFLASPAASFITGAVLPVDGGNSIGF